MQMHGVRDIVPWVESLPYMLAADPGLNPDTLRTTEYHQK